MSMFVLVALAWTSLGLAAESDLCLLQLDAQKLENSKCLPPGKLLFIHVMKDAGESVNNYMKCLCDKKTCSIAQREGPSESTWGVKKCEPTVCSSHGQVAERGNNCGAAFWGSKMFTVLRDPVDRVFSLYNYYKYNMGEEYFLKHSLVEILHMVKDCKANPKCTSSVAEGHSQISEGMVNWYFANTYTNSFAMRSPDVLFNEFGQIDTKSFDPLDHAKKELAKVDAVFYVDDFERFAHLWGKSGLPLSFEEEPDCEFVTVGANMCKDCKITKEETNLIIELNQMDLELYNYSKTLPNVVS